MSGTGTESANGWELRLGIAGVDGTRKAAMVESVVEALPGIRWARVDYALAHIDIRGRGDIDEDELVAAVAGTGCSLHAMEEDDDGHDDHAEAHASRPKALPAPVVQSEPEPEPEEEEQPIVEPEPADDNWKPERQESDALKHSQTSSDDDDDFVDESSRGINAFGIFAHVVLWCFCVSLIWAAAYRLLPVPMTVPMFSDAVFENGGVRNQWVPLTQISPNLIRAVIASEDNEFCHHYGFDFEEIHDAIREAQRGGRSRGASTISQQTAKNAFLWTDHSWVRKALEAYFTLVIEAMWPKRRIMEVYLNIAEWGPGIYGAEAASRHWFHKPASRLSMIEAARLAAILPSGGRWRASGAGPYVVSRAYTIQARANSVDLNGDDRCAHP
jgi:monofunctional biosynthetic peptidoglycan transglycosylase